MGSRSPAGVWVKDQNTVDTQHTLHQDNKLVPVFTWASEGNPGEWGVVVRRGLLGAFSLLSFGPP